MRKNIYKLFLLASLSSFCLLIGIETASARYYIGKGQGPKPTNTAMKVAAGCDPPTSQIDLDINNVRAKLLNGGDMWWDIFGGTNARYEIPKVKPGERSIHASFASALWFGGVDDGNQLKTAGQTYRQRGIDFWPGPLDTTNAEVTADVCKAYDKQFKVEEKNIFAFVNGSKAATAEILSWPGNGNQSLGQSQFLAPFADVDGDGIYNPGNGDYPTLDPNVLGARPDQMIWWVYNDKGGTHTAYPGGEAIGLEIQALAFAFTTANEINNMTFYKYRVANRASSPLYDTYFGVFTDSDLGGATDDYVGCNMALVDPDGPVGPLLPKRRSFGYTYNADDNDEDVGGTPGYGKTPPIFGIDFFRGPKDENGNELPMSTFMFFTNQGVTGINSDPQNATELYRYLRGFWADGAFLSYNTPTGRGGADQCNYAFPGTTDPDGRVAWNESDVPGDRRMVQSAGPFTLQPGAINEVIIGAVWSRAKAGDQFASIATGIIADDKAQVLFDNDFKLANGPDPVTVVLTPSDKKIIMTLEGTDKTEKYNKFELDNEDLISYKYKFQGYRVFQMKNGSVSAADIGDISKVAEIAQFDIFDSITGIVNKKFDPLSNNVNGVLEVDGEDAGIKHVLSIETDAFATSSDGKLINGKTYYYLVVPYGYSDSAKFTKYLPGRTSTIVVNTTVGRQIVNGLINGTFSENVPITRLDGIGNGGVRLDLTAASEAAIVANTSGVPVSYELGSGPVYIKVFDPTKIQKRNYSIVFNQDMKSYVLKDANTGDTLMISDTTYSKTNTLTDNQQIAEVREYKTLVNGTRVLDKRTSLGFYIVMNNLVGRPGVDAKLENNNFLDASITFADPSKKWLEGFNGKLDLEVANPKVQGWVEGNLNIDKQNVYGNILGATWAPYKVLRAVSSVNGRSTPMLDPGSKSAANSKLDSIGSYDIVFTSDTTKWSECVVIESGIISSSNPVETTEGLQKRFNLRKKDIGYGLGKSKFPGYAINLETGERVNIFFAEASGLTSDNGNDMLWNPTSNKNFFDKGGRHFVYVTRRRYDKCNEIHALLTKNVDNTTNPDKYKIFGMVDWVNIPILAEGQTLLATDVKVKLRVAKPYDKNPYGGLNSGAPSFNFDDISVTSGATSDDNTNKKLAMDLVNIVPNPYYAYSSYEPDRNDYRVRVTNLPPTATVTIYTSSGILVRRLSKSDALQTYIEWDLRNANRIPIASGVYIIHVNCPGVGEKTLKWMGVMRPVDFTNF